MTRSRTGKPGCRLCTARPIPIGHCCTEGGVHEPSSNRSLRPIGARRTVAFGTVLGGFAVALITPSVATEGGASLYVPEVGVPNGGILPPPGVDFDNTAYFYMAEISGSRTTRLGNIVADVKVDIWADFITGLWVTPIKTSADAS